MYLRFVCSVLFWFGYFPSSSCDFGVSTHSASTGLALLMLCALLPNREGLTWKYIILLGGFVFPLIIGVAVYVAATPMTADSSGLTTKLRSMFSTPGLAALLFPGPPLMKVLVGATHAFAAVLSLSLQWYVY